MRFVHPRVSTVTQPLEFAFEFAPERALRLDARLHDVDRIQRERGERSAQGTCVRERDARASSSETRKEIGRRRAGRTGEGLDENHIVRGERSATGRDGERG